MMCQHDVIIRFFLCPRVFIVKFSYWFKFHINIISGQELWQFLFIRDLTRNLEMRMQNYQMLWNSRFREFIVFELLEENQQGKK